MNIEATKLELMQLLLNTNKENILMKIKHIFQEEEKDWWADLSAAEQSEIEEGLKQAEKGEVASHSTVIDDNLTKYVASK